MGSNSAALNEGYNPNINPVIAETIKEIKIDLTDTIVFQPA